MFLRYSWFHKKGTFSVHSFNGDYLSIPEGTGSCVYLFHEIPGSISSTLLALPHFNFNTRQNPHSLVILTMMLILAPKVPSQMHHCITLWPIWIRVRAWTCNIFVSDKEGGGERDPHACLLRNVHYFFLVFSAHTIKERGSS